MMHYLFLVVILVTNGPREIAKINQLKKEAEKAYLAGSYTEALEKYNYLIDSLALEDESIYLNKAHCLYQLGDTATAKDTYGQVVRTGSNETRSIAYQQLGVMAKSPQTLPQALQYLKASLKSNPNNIDARYDYEVVKKLLEQQQQNQQNQQDQDKQDQQDQENQENQDQQNQQQDQENQENQENQQQENQQQESEESDEQQEGEEQEQQQEAEAEQSEEEQEQQRQQEIKEKLEEMNISEEKAKMILEALRNNEIQYIQQQKRKATKRPDSSKPDW